MYPSYFEILVYGSNDTTWLKFKAYCSQKEVTLVACSNQSNYAQKLIYEFLEVNLQLCETFKAEYNRPRT